MKQYFIEVNYTQSGLCAMERDLLDQAKPFNNCIIMDAYVDELVAYFGSLQIAFHKVKPKLKTVDISHWPAGKRRGPCGYGKEPMSQDIPARGHRPDPIATIKIEWEE